jgi:hypothetical protein
MTQYEGRLLADQQHIDSAQVEIIVERESSKPIISRVHSSIKLSENSWSEKILAKIGMG